MPARKSIASRGYRLLVRLFPGELRERYGDEMAHAFDRSLEEVRSERAWSRLWLALAGYLDVVRAAFHARRTWQGVGNGHSGMGGDAMGEGAWWSGGLTDLAQDVRFALRALARTRGFTLVAIVSLAVGIGVNTAVFTGIQAIWLGPVPGVGGQDRLVEVIPVERGSDGSSWAYPDFEDVRHLDTPLQALTGFTGGRATLGVADGGRRISTGYVTSNYFDVLGASPVLGRGFLESENSAPGQNPVVVLGHRVWRDDFEADPNIVGTSIVLNRVPYTVVGVAAEGFTGTRPTMSRVDLWLPLMEFPPLADETVRSDRDWLWLQVIGRLEPGATIDEANAALQTVFARLEAEHPTTNEGRSVRAASFGRFPAQNRIYDLVAVAALAGMLVLVLLIICGNLAGMMLARSASREREIAVRLALGSGRVRLVRHLMIEALVLAFAGGALGIWVATQGMSMVSPATFGIVAPGVSFDIQPGVIAAALALTVAAALAFGLLPAVRFSRPELVSSLKDDSGTGGRRVGRIQRLAASAQAGVALLLLVVGGLFVRSLDAAAEKDLGFEPDQLYVTDFRSSALLSPMIDLAEEGYPSLDEGAGPFLDGMARALEQAPGVEAFAFSDGMPLDRSGNPARVSRADEPSDDAEGVVTELTRIGEGYFETIGATLLQGRSVQATDDTASEPVIIVSAALSGRLWPGQEALGRTLTLSQYGREERSVTVVGVVQDMASSRPTESVPNIFIPLRQDYRARMMIALRSAAGRDEMTRTLRSVFRAVDAALPVPGLSPSTAMVERSMQDQRGAARVGGGLGLLTVLLAAIGVYGVVAMTVSNRTREIGLRMAMGASRQEVLWGVLKDAIRLTLPGLVIGALAAVGTAATLRSMLFGVSPIDPIAFGSAGLLIVAVVLLASFVPARRASVIQPVDALRAD